MNVLLYVLEMAEQWRYNQNTLAGGALPQMRVSTIVENVNFLFKLIFFDIQ